MFHTQNIEIISKGNIFHSRAACLVNPVNCEGVSGKGLAQKFAENYPDNQEYYRNCCTKGYLRPGKICVCFRGTEYSPVYVANFPTKDSWRNPSSIEYVQTGLDALLAFVNTQPMYLDSIAIPALGCGLGGLQSEIVIPMIEKALKSISHKGILKAKIYLPY